MIKETKLKEELILTMSYDKMKALKQNPNQIIFLEVAAHNLIEMLIKWRFLKIVRIQIMSFKVVESLQMISRIKNYPKIEVYLNAVITLAYHNH